MVDRAQFTGGVIADYPVPLSPTMTVPTYLAANFLARLCELTPTCKVLEIGTGSGYQAAILAGLCKEVVTIEIDPIAGTSDKLPSNVTAIVADGVTYDTGEEFDVVLVTFAAPAVARVWDKQLAEGGRLVIPEGKDICPVHVYRKRNGLLRWPEIHGYAKFTPMVRSA